METLIVFPLGSELKVIGLVFALDVVFWDFKFVTVFGVGPVNATRVFELLSNLLQDSLHSSLNLINYVICTIEIFI